MQSNAFNEITNQFGIMDMKTHTLRPLKLRDFVGGTHGVDELAGMFQKSRASMYRESVKLDRKFIEDYLVPIVWAADRAYELFDKDKERARAWMLEPNSYFFGKSPFNMCLLGKGEAVREFLNERSGRG